MIVLCREVPLQTLRLEADLLLREQVDEGTRMYAEGARAAMMWLLDPRANPAPSEILLIPSGQLQ